MLKKCSKCKEEKDTYLFSKDSSKKSGLNSHCKDCVREYQIANKNKKSQYDKLYQEVNKERDRLRIIEYRVKNKKNKSLYDTEYQKNRMHNDPIYKIKHSIRNSIRDSFKRGLNDFSKKRSTEHIMGCTMTEFINHIESKFKEGMTFQNYGKYGWHLDHIIPLSKAKTEKEIINLNHYSNFQPLWAEDNLKKYNKLNYGTSKYLYTERGS